MLTVMIFSIPLKLEPTSFCIYYRCILRWHFPCEVYYSYCVPTAYEYNCFYDLVDYICYDRDGNEYHLSNCRTADCDIE